MLCSRFKQILLTKSTLNKNVRCRCLSTTNNILKKYWKDSFLTSILKSNINLTKMSPIRFILKDLRIVRFWSVWTRNVNVGSVVRRCRRDRSVREMLQCVRQTFLKSRRTFLLAGSAAYKIDGEDSDELPPCEKNITDEDLQMLLTDLETIQILIKKTLYCTKCNERIVIDKKVPGVKYCICKEPQIPGAHDGWVPYMEEDDVIIWRKEHKRHGLFAYKVYGRYKEVIAQHFAAIQVDGGYRRIWDSAVAALSIVERSANGILDQAVLHWEVLWPRLFANRDYVYIRRHKEFDLSAQVVPTPIPTTEQNTPITEQKPPTTQQNTPPITQNPATTKQTPVKTQPNPSTLQKTPLPGQNSPPSPPTRQNPPTTGQNQPPTRQNSPPTGQNQPPTRQNSPPTGQNSPPTRQNSPPTGQNQPPTRQNPIPPQKPTQQQTERPSVHSNAKRKSEEMYKEVTKEVEGDRAFVIVSRSCIHPEVPETKHAIRVTEYWSHMVVKTTNGADNPGMEFVLTYYDEPAVGGLPTGVASWATGRAAPAFLMNMRKAANDYKEYAKRRRGKDGAPDFTPFRPDKVSYNEEAKIRHREIVSEEEMESSQQGPELENGEIIEVTREKSTQTEFIKTDIPTEDKAVETTKIYSKQETPQKPDDKDDPEKPEEEEQSSSWWRHLYPFYYFV